MEVIAFREVYKPSSAASGPHPHAAWRQGVLCQGFGQSYSELSASKATPPGTARSAAQERPDGVGWPRCGCLRGALGIPMTRGIIFLFFCSLVIGVHAIVIWCGCILYTCHGFPNNKESYRPL